jgi:hypothetical protein
MPINPNAPANPGSGGPYYPPQAPQPPILTPPFSPGTNRQLQGTLSIGSNILITCPNFFNCRITLRFNNPIAYDVTLNITRGSTSLTPGTLQCYSLTLDPGDTVEDQGYLLARGDSIVVDTTTAGTNYFITLNYTPGY